MRGRCDTCRFYDTSVQRVEMQNLSGACRAALPTPDDRNGQARWPMPEWDDWCSHYRPDTDHDPMRRLTHPVTDDDILF